MENTNTVSEKMFIGLGIITIISGVVLAIQGDTLIGISGSIVGVWLMADNIKKMKAKHTK